MKITDIRVVDSEASELVARWRNWLGQVVMEAHTDTELTSIGVDGGGQHGLAPYPSRKGYR